MGRCALKAVEQEATVSRKRHPPKRQHLIAGGAPPQRGQLRQPGTDRGGIAVAPASWRLASRRPRQPAPGWCRQQLVGADHAQPACQPLGMTPGHRIRRRVASIPPAARPRCRAGSAARHQDRSARQRRPPRPGVAGPPPRQAAGVHQNTARVRHRAAAAAAAANLRRRSSAFADEPGAENNTAATRGTVPGGGADCGVPQWPPRSRAHLLRLGGGGPIQRRGEVGDQVARVLDTNGQAQQVVGDAHIGGAALAPSRRGSWWRDGR